MSDEFSPLRPAIPSRATGEMKPVTERPAPMFDDQPEAMRPERRAPFKKKPAAKKAKPRKTPVKKAAKKTVARRTGKRPALAAPYEAKNPNRPLEMKNRLHTVLSAVAAMSKAEATAFTGVMQHLEDMSRSSRKRIITALAHVYAS